MNDNAEPLGLGVGITGGVSAGAAVGAVVGPVGAVVGAFVGGVAGGFAGVSAAEVLTTPSYLTTGEVAERLHLKRAAVYRLIRLNKLPAEKARNQSRYRVSAENLEAFMRQQATT
jgi:excisionase family DNA binding protein